VSWCERQERPRTSTDFFLALAVLLEEPGFVRVFCSTREVSGRRVVHGEFDRALASLVLVVEAEEELAGVDKRFPAPVDSRTVSPQLAAVRRRPE
jgi:hypothetical protein